MVNLCIRTNPVTTLPKIGAAGGENHLVGGVLPVSGRDGAVPQLLRQAEGGHHLAEG